MNIIQLYEWWWPAFTLKKKIMSVLQHYTMNQSNKIDKNIYFCPEWKSTQKLKNETVQCSTLRVSEMQKKRYANISSKIYSATDNPNTLHRKHYKIREIKKVREILSFCTNFNTFLIQRITLCYLHYNWIWN